MLGTYHLTSLFDILNKIHFVYEPPKLWSFILAEACKTLQAEAGTFFEIYNEGKELKVTACHGVDFERLNQVPFQIGVGISGWVAQFNQPALVPDVRHDHRFNRAADVVTGFDTKSVVCVPIFSQKKAYGVLEIINRKSGQFNPQDQEFMTLLGRQAAVAYQNLLLLNEISHTKVLLESVLENLSGGLIARDQAGLITILNPAAGRLLGLGAGTWLGQSAAVVLKEQPWFVEIMEKTLAANSTVSRQETALTLGGQSARVGYSTILISDHDKNLLGSGIIFQKLNS